MMSQQQGSFVIERPLVIKSTDIEKLRNFSTWPCAGLMWHGTVAGNILARGHEVQIGASLDPYTAAAAGPITGLQRPAQICIRKHSPRACITCHPTHCTEGQVSWIGAVKRVGIWMIISIQNVAMKMLSLCDRLSDGLRDTVIFVAVFPSRIS
jgi:hypothetical protein